MRHSFSIVLAATITALAAARPAPASELLWSNPHNGNSVTEPSMLVLGTLPPTDAEVADDFDVDGSIERLIVHGNDCFSCAAPPLTGVYVRFLTWTPTGPGALQAEHFLAAGDPGFIYDPDGRTCSNPGQCPADLDGNGSVNVDDLVLVFTNWS